VSGSSDAEGWATKALTTELDRVKKQNEEGEEETTDLAVVVA